MVRTVAATAAREAVPVEATGRGVPWTYMADQRVNLIVIFGGLTLYFRDKNFILWKPTILYWLFGGILAGGALTGRNLIRSLLSEQLQLPDRIWARLNWSWVAFFAFMGAVNLYVAFNYSEKVWASFKLFGGMGLMFLFIIVQSLFLAKHVD